MLDQLLPQRIDNAYRGHRLALWLFALVVTVRTLQSLPVAFAGESVIQSADGIPLDTFTPAGAQTVVAVWAQLGIACLMTLFLGVLVLVRYRSAIPLMFALLVLHYPAGQLIVPLVPIIRSGSPPGPVVNLILFVLMLGGLALALLRQGPRSEETSGATYRAHAARAASRATRSTASASVFRVRMVKVITSAMAHRPV